MNLIASRSARRKEKKRTRKYHATIQSWLLAFRSCAERANDATLFSESDLFRPETGTESLDSRAFYATPANRISPFWSARLNETDSSKAIPFFAFCYEFFASRFLDSPEGIRDSRTGCQGASTLLQILWHGIEKRFLIEPGNGKPSVFLCNSPGNRKLPSFSVSSKGKGRRHAEGREKERLSR